MGTRRSFLAGLAAGTALPALSWAEAGGPAYLGAARDADGGYAIYGLSAVGDPIFRVPLLGRGHAATAHPDRPETVAFARRPGTFALVIDCATGTLRHRLDAPAGRHFYGHGTFIAGGDILCTTENEIESGAGRIGLWDRRAGYRRMGEVATGGIGPHDIRTLSDGRTLVVANGGIRTDPGHGREKLNLDTMRPSLAFVDPETGPVELIELDPDLQWNSIRHLAVGPDDDVAFAMQWQGDPMEAPPLLGLVRRGGTPILAAADLGEQMSMQGYAGSVAIDGAGARIGITSPRGGRMHIFDREGQFHGAVLRADICGLATAPGGFTASDGTGGVLRIEQGEVRAAVTLPGLSWDNHLVAIG
ncbi:DUF1513 domain-containing protein [Palleronia aestuarii]|nr:DUF1513 domain-containing protein [Palleronia aestuarii]